MQVPATMQIKPIMLEALSGAAPIINVRPHTDNVPKPPQPAESSSVPEIERRLNRLAEGLNLFDISLKFSKDDETGSIVVEFIDQRSGETLRQIPSAARLHVAATLSELQGKIFNRKA